MPGLWRRTERCRTVSLHRWRVGSSSPPSAPSGEPPPLGSSTGFLCLKKKPLHKPVYNLLYTQEVIRLQTDGRLTACFYSGVSHVNGATLETIHDQNGIEMQIC